MNEVHDDRDRNLGFFAGVIFIFGGGGASTRKLNR
jgi:hypothetical protein